MQLYPGDGMSRFVFCDCMCLKNSNMLPTQAVFRVKKSDLRAALKKKKLLPLADYLSYISNNPLLASIDISATNFKRELFSVWYVTMEP